MIPSKEWISGLLMTTFIWKITLCNTDTNAVNESHGPKQDKPHIIMIIADDMGWNDVSFHGSDEIPTPNIDALAYNGVILNSHYTAPICTPSRAALLTGKYPTRLGMQHYVLRPPEPRGLPLDQKLLPEYFQDAGYKTHAVGKWHLGYFKKEYTPTNRGFDTFYGYWNGYHDYYTHSLRTNQERFDGLDFRNNLTAIWDSDGKYSTDLFTKEAVKLINKHDQSTPMFMYLSHLAPHSGDDNDLQAPEDEIEKYSYIKNYRRRIYAAMVSKLDQSVGDVVEALQQRDMLKNSIIIFISDNGAPTVAREHANEGSNYPLRGVKVAPWEGAIRGVAAIWSPLIKRKRVSNDLMYITDWLPTLLSATDLNLQSFGRIDGVDLWSSLISGEPSPRTEILINIDPFSNYSAIRRGDYKYISGSTGEYNDWYGQTQEDVPVYNPETVINSKVGEALAEFTLAQHADQKSASKSAELTSNDILKIRRQAQLSCNVIKRDEISCDSKESPCLFNIKDDPCELVNIAEKNKLIVGVLKLAIFKHGIFAKCPSNLPSSKRANPKYWNNTWAPWEEGTPSVESEQTFLLSFNSVVGTVPLYSNKCNKVIAKLEA